MHLSQTEIKSLRPKSVVGGISNEESYFLYNIIQTFNPKNIVEVGVASGWSSSIILMAVNDLMKANPDSKYKFCGIDIDTHCYYDRDRLVGYTIDEVIPADGYKGEIVRDRSVFAIQNRYQENEIDLIFIDANHKHPYPAIDMLVALPYLKENAVVVLHDTNLPLINQDFPSNGAKYLFDAIETQFKFNCPATKRNNEISNMGAFVINSKESLKSEVQEMMGKFEDEMELTGDYSNFGQQKAA